MAVGATYMDVVLHSHPTHGESHIQHNTNREVATPTHAFFIKITNVNVNISVRQCLNDHIWFLLFQELENHIRLSPSI